MNEELFRQLIAELLDANEQAFAVLAGAIGDVVGAAALSGALQVRLTRARAAQSHPIRDKLLDTAVRVLKAKS